MSFYDEDAEVSLFCPKDFYTLDSNYKCTNPKCNYKVEVPKNKVVQGKIIKEEKKRKK